jgi:hypothetical protein
VIVGDSADNLFFLLGGDDSLDGGATPRSVTS